MARLETVVPPPVWALLFAAVIVGIGRLDLGGAVGGLGSLGFVVAAAGVGIAMLGVFAVARAGTTIDPHDPAKSSTLVTGGIYRVTRNPMYLGLVLVLGGFGLWLGEPAGAVVGGVGFIAVVTRLQIIPEERALMDRFPDAFREFRSRTRRWV
ncbi:MAG: isoprenylcysteine carboxylmethyltransferase family protein [Actinomycetota bacterium]